MIDPTMFDLAELINSLLGYTWQHDCEIVPAYMPPFPRGDTQPSCVVRYRHPGEAGWRDEPVYSYMRHSRGPGTGCGWDIYGDDFLRPELALVELAKAPAPPRVCVIPTHGKPRSHYCPAYTPTMPAEQPANPS